MLDRFSIIESTETQDDSNHLAGRSGFLQSDWMLFGSLAISIVLGSFTYSIYPLPVNIVALLALIGLFYYWLDRGDLTAFFIQLLIGDFFIFGAKYGGNYNLAAILSILFYNLSHGSIKHIGRSSLSSFLMLVLTVWWLVQVLSVFAGNDFEIVSKIQGVFVFSMLVYLFYFISKLPVDEKSIMRVIKALALFFFYLFLVALNQRYEIINWNMPFFPLNEESVDYDLGIVRSGSTLNNFESYAEYCVSYTAILLPSVFSGSLYTNSKKVYYLVLLTLIISIIAIVFTATRSSILLLPFSFIGALIMLGKRAKFYLILKSVGIIAILFLSNYFLEIIDISVFVERSSDINLKSLDLNSIISGEEMNRGSVFEYAKEQIAKSNGILGRGYFSSPEEYRAVHFPVDNIGDGIADYHNIFFSSYVLWGSIGLLCLLILFLSSIFKGLKVYWKFRLKNSFLVDLVLGFSIMFSLLLINQFKIQFIRDLNYFSIIMMLLAFFIAVTKYVHDDLE